MSWPTEIKKPTDTSPKRSLEADCDAEVAKVQTEFAKRAAVEAARFADATSSDFFAYLVFDTQAARDAFVAAMGLVLQENCLDGHALADKLKVPIPGRSTRRLKRKTAWDKHAGGY